MNLQQLSSWENCLTNCVIKPRFCQSFCTTWTTFQGPKSLLNLLPKHQWNRSTLHPGYSEFIFLQPWPWSDFCCTNSEVWSYCATKHPWWRDLGTTAVAVALYGSNSTNSVTSAASLSASGLWILLDNGNNRGDFTRALIYRWCFRGAQWGFPAHRVMGCDTSKVTLSFSWAFVGVGWSLKLDRKKQRMTTNELCNWL